MTPTTLAEALLPALVFAGVDPVTYACTMDDHHSPPFAEALAARLLALPPDRRAALAAELLDVETLAAALDALPPLPFGLLNEKAIVAMDELPTSRGWATAILAALRSPT